MPDDYPRDAWSPKATVPNIVYWERLLSEFDLDVEPARNPKTFADLAREEMERMKSFEQVAELMPSSYSGIVIDEQIEYVNRRQMREMIRLLAKTEGGLIELVKAHLHFGNRKLPENYLIWNLNPAHMCPSLKNERGKLFNYLRDGAPDAEKSFCQAFNEKGTLVCYAWGAEIGYKDCFPYRIRQNELWRSLLRDNPQYMIEAVKEIHANKLETDKPIVAFRWSESGDLEDQKSLNSAMKISLALARLPVPDRIVTVLEKDHELPGTGQRTAKGKWIKGTGKIIRKGMHEAPWKPGRFVSYLYSARQDLDFSRARENELVVLGSDWEDKHAPGLSGQFVMVEDPSDPPAVRGENWKMCPMKCRICQRCPSGLSSRVLNH